MFSYRKFDVDIARDVSFERLTWPRPGEAVDEYGLGMNRQYMDLRRLPWSEAKRVFDEETGLIERIEKFTEPEEEYDAIEEELFDKLDDLDLGVASTVIAVSAARCVPFTSCNAGAYGGRHTEQHPLVGFFARVPMGKLILACAEDCPIGLHTHENGCLVAYADDIRAMRKFAATLIERRKLFRDLRMPRKAKARGASDSETGQASLF